MWKIRYQTLGGHTHCALFWKQAPHVGTWAKCGDFVIDKGDLASLRSAMQYVEFEERSTSNVSQKT